MSKEEEDKLQEIHRKGRGFIIGARPRQRGQVSKWRLLWWSLMLKKKAKKQTH